MTSCGNCQTTQGPFSRRAGLGPLCAPTPASVERDMAKADPAIKACNLRRRKLDIERYKETD